ncbi:MAG: hypothetical protein KDD53_06135 [Bdellovibrionales bacterium]|nr:hypothetical protein [Bdellovibrionales bacterium]
MQKFSLPKDCRAILRERTEVIMQTTHLSGLDESCSTDSTDASAASRNGTRNGLALDGRLSGNGMDIAK